MTPPEHLGAGTSVLSLATSPDLIPRPYMQCKLTNSIDELLSVCQVVVEHFACTNSFNHHPALGGGYCSHPCFTVEEMETQSC